MKFLAVHPSPLMYTKVFLRLEPLGLELVAETARRAGHQVRLVDLQAETHRDFYRELETWRPDASSSSAATAPHLPRQSCCNTAKARSIAC